MNAIADQIRDRSSGAEQPVWAGAQEATASAPAPVEPSRWCVTIDAILLADDDRDLRSWPGPAIGQMNGSAWGSWNFAPQIDMFGNTLQNEMSCSCACVTASAGRAVDVALHQLVAELPHGVSLGTTRVTVESAEHW